jgi:integrase
MGGPVSSITRDRSGAWRARYRDPEGKQRSRNFSRRRDAELFLTSTEHAKASGSYVDPVLGKITFDTWAKEWRAGIVDLRPSTLARDDGYLKRYLQPTFGEKRLAEIDHAVVRAWVAGLIARGLAPSTVVLAGLLMRKIMATAVTAGRIPASPCNGIRLPRIEREEARFLAPTEIGALTDTINERYRGLVMLGAFGGLRIGEMLGLRAKHLDLLHGRVNVTEILVEVSGQLYFGPPKTRAGRRAVPLPRVAIDALDDHLRRYPAAQGDLVFSAPEGGPVRLASWRRRFWKPAVEVSGLSPLRPHDLRHTAVALWIAAGATPREIATRAGHTSVVTVLDRYGHLFPDSEQKVNAALDVLAKDAGISRSAQVVSIREVYS